jgi:CRP/FNR family transcriptional regulator
MVAGLPKIRAGPCPVCECTGCLFTYLDRSEKLQLAQLISYQTYAKREIIFQQGDEISGCHILCHGKVELACYTPEGRRQIVRFLSSGELFGESGLYEANASSVTAKALVESVIGWLRSADFQELLRQNSSLALEIQKRLIQEVDELRVRLTDQSYQGTRERLIKLLLELAEKYGHRSDQEVLIDLELTERDLAEMLGITPEWICKQLGVLKRRGFIAYRRGELVILDEASLRRPITPPKHYAISQFWRRPA